VTGTLWVVATPIGNLEDVTLRALRVLREADGVLAEDTRRTRRLLSHHGIPAALRAFHAHTDPGRTHALVAELAAGARLALVSDAGTPLVSDPGVGLVAAAREAGIRVEAVPGPSAVTAALTVAGLRCDGFRFWGFLPRSGGRRRRALQAIGRDPGAGVLFESPHRLARTLSELGELLGEQRRIAVCRELTKVHQEVVRGSAAELAERFAEGARGEITLVVEAVGEGWDDALPAPVADRSWAGAAGGPADDEVARWLAEGMSPRDAATRLAREAGVRRPEAYRRVQAVRARVGPGSPAGAGPVRDVRGGPGRRGS